MDVSWKGWWLRQAGLDESHEEIGAIGYTFAHTLKAFAELGLPSSLDEESMTGALLGGFAASFKPAVCVFGADVNQKCSWARYRKGGKKDDSESVRGADFALVIAIDSETSRLAIFQAKKVKFLKGKYLIDLHHLPGGDSKRTPQLVALLNTGKQILKSAKIKNVDFSWIHYLAYGDSGVTHSPLSSFAVRADSYSRGEVDGSLMVPVDSFAIFRDLLLAGCDKVKSDEDLCCKFEREDCGSDGDDVNEESFKCHGWLSLPNSSLEKIIPKLLDIMDVCIADEGSGGVVLKNTSELKGGSMTASPPGYDAPHLHQTSKPRGP